MRTILFIFTLFVALTSGEVKADFCGPLSMIPGLSFLDGFYKKDCSAFTEEADFCECILKDNKNIVQKAFISKTQNSVPQGIQQFKVSETSKLLGVYQKVVLGSNSQLKALGMPVEDPVCTPKVFTDGLDTTITSHADKQAKADLKKAKEGGIEIEDEEKYHADRKTEVKNSVFQGVSQACSIYSKLPCPEISDDSTPKSELSQSSKDTLISRFKGINNLAINVNKNSFTEMPEGYCVSYNDFVAMRGMPSDSFLTQFRNESDKAEFLNPVGIPDPKALEFLRGNPALGKLLLDKENRKKLADKISLLADKMAVAKNKNEKFTAYANFMKNDVNEMLKNREDADSEICLNLARNIAAIQTTDKVPDLEVNMEDNSGMEFFYNAQACTYKKQNKKDNLNLKYTLEMNPLFMIYGEEVDTTSGDTFYNHLDAKNDEHYAKYNKEHCKGFAEFKNAYIEHQCSKGKPNCRQNLEAKLRTIKDSQDLRDHFASSLPTDSEISSSNTALKSNGLGKPISDSQLDSIGKGMNANKISKKAETAFNKLLDAAKDMDFIAEYGKEEKYAESQNKVYESVKSGQTNQAPIPTVADQSVVDPSWANESEVPYSVPEFTPESISQGSQAFLPKNFASLPPENKIKAVESVEANLNKFEVSKTDQVNDLRNEIQNLREELADAKTNAHEEIVEQVSKVASKKDTASNTVANNAQDYNNNRTILPSGFSTGGSMGTFNPSSNAGRLNGGTQSDLTKTATDRDNALLSSKYASQGKEASRGIASVDGLVVVSNEAVTVVPTGIGMAKSLTVTDAQLGQFKGSSEALNKELQSRISELGLVPGVNKVVEIKAKDSDKKMYLHAVWKNNTWVFHPFSKNIHAALARTHTLKGLSNTLPLN